MDVATGLELIAQEYPQFPIREAFPIQSGWDSFILEVDQEWVFRFPRRPEVLPGLEKELRLLPLLAPVLPLAVPQVELVSRGEAGSLRFVGYRKIPGQALSREALAEKAVAGGLAAFLDRLHSLPLKLAKAADLPLNDAQAWRCIYVDFSEWACREALPRLTPLARQAAEQFWDDFLEDEGNFTFQPRLIHGDLGAEHILVDPAQKRLTGVIDWEDATVGDPALDYAGLFHLAGLAGVERVLAQSQRTREASFLRRVTFYAALAPFHQMRFGLESGDEAMVRAALFSLERTYAAS